MKPMIETIVNQDEARAHLEAAILAHERSATVHELAAALHARAAELQEWHADAERDLERPQRAAAMEAKAAEERRRAACERGLAENAYQRADADWARAVSAPDPEAIRAPRSDRSADRRLECGGRNEAQRRGEFVALLAGERDDGAGSLEVESVEVPACAGAGDDSIVAVGEPDGVHGLVGPEVHGIAAVGSQRGRPGGGASGQLWTRPP
jgi:hypothetical protein